MSGIAPLEARNCIRMESCSCIYLHPLWGPKGVGGEGGSNWAGQCRKKAARLGTRVGTVHL